MKTTFKMHPVKSEKHIFSETIRWVRPSHRLPGDRREVLFFGSRGLAFGIFYDDGSDFRGISELKERATFFDEVRSPFLVKDVSWWAYVPVGPVAK